MPVVVTRFVTRASWAVLITLAVVFLASALWITYRVVVCGSTEPSLTVAALLATVAGLFLTAQQQIANREETTSRFYLEQYLEGFDTAYEILESARAGDPLLRMKWIAAARLLADATKMHDRISVPAHRLVARMSIPHQSQRFWKFFDEPATYYYGVVVVHASTVDALDEAARQSSKGSGTLISTLRLVPEKVIHAVWQAVSYPKSYRDPLGEKFSDADRMWLPNGLKAYLDHRDCYDTAAGNLHERTPGEQRE